MKNRHLQALHAADVAKWPWLDSVSVATPERIPRWAEAADEAFGLCGVCLDLGDEKWSAVAISPSVNLPPSHPLNHWARSAGGAALMAWHSYRTDVDLTPILRPLIHALVARIPAKTMAIDAAGAGMDFGVGVFPDYVLTDSGFQLNQSHPNAGPVQQYRLSIDGTVSWRESLENAWDTLQHWVSGPLPAPGQTRDSAVRGSL